MPIRSPSFFSTLSGSPSSSKWIRLLLSIAAISTIYFLGTSFFSAARMRLLIDPVLGAIVRGDSGTQLLFFDNFIRWTAHYLEYFVVFLFLVWALRSRPLTALVIAVALAVADEGHQYFLPDRTCSLLDIKVDAAGAATAFILMITIRFLRGARFRPLSLVSDGEDSAPPQPETPPVKSPN